jgi:hypothetical protein
MTAQLSNGPGYIDTSAARLHQRLAAPQLDLRPQLFDIGIYVDTGIERHGKYGRHGG